MGISIKQTKGLDLRQDLLDVKTPSNSATLIIPILIILTFIYNIIYNSSKKGNKSG